MPEDAEVETEKLHEAIEEELEKEPVWFASMVAGLVGAILAGRVL